jgi:hypothetical protein
MPHLREKMTIAPQHHVQFIHSDVTFGAMCVTGPNQTLNPRVVSTPVQLDFECWI